MAARNMPQNIEAEMSVLGVPFLNPYAMEKITENLTEDIKNKVSSATILTEVEDIYRPFKPKKRTRATIAKELGLGELAKIIIKQNIKMRR